METDDLIRRLASEVRPVPAHAAETRLAAGIAAGSAAAVALLQAWLGVRPDLIAALASFAFLMKAAYTLSIAAVAILIARHLARPESRPERWYLLLAAPVVVLTALAGHEVLTSAPADRMALLLGHSARQCSVRILTLSLPVFAGLMWAFRRFAPTRPRAAGAAAGLAAGAIGACVYLLHCSESTATFVLVWYTLGISLPALAGALLGPTLLRW